MTADLWRRVRQNHAFEHATIHLLEQRYPSARLGGRASTDGFYLLGDLPELSVVYDAAEEMLRRLKNGQHNLAVHPRCGTNLVAAGLLSGALALLSTWSLGRRAPWHLQLYAALLGGLTGALIAQPVGPWLQQNITTLADVRDLQLVGVEARRSLGDWRVCFVRTATLS